MNVSAPALTIVAMLLTTIIAILLPIILLIVLYRKTRVNLMSAAMGAASFALFAVIIGSAVNSFLFFDCKPTADFLMSSVVIYTVVRCLLTGALEEAGRLGSWALLNKLGHNSFPAAVGFGIGYAGIESILVTGPTILSNLLAAMALNSTGLEATLESVAPEEQEQLKEALISLAETPATDYLAGGLERLAAMAFAIALSVLMWMIVTKRLPFFMFPVVIVLHAGINVLSCVYTYYDGGVSLWAIELYFVLYTLAACYLTYLLYQKFGRGEPVKKLPKGHA